MVGSEEMSPTRLSVVAYQWIKKTGKNLALGEVYLINHANLEKVTIFQIQFSFMSE